MDRRCEVLRLKLSPKKIFYHPDFDSRQGRNQICQPMPDLEKYQQKKQELLQDLAKGRIRPALQPCYQEPLLSREQERHLFRQYALFKYAASKRLHARHTTQAGLLYARAVQISKQIATANLRLAVPVIRRFYNQKYYEDLVAEAYYLIARGVDFFDWRRNFKFSTYATWCLIRTLPRPNMEMCRFDEFFEQVPDNHIPEKSLVMEEDEEIALLDEENCLSQIEELMTVLDERERIVIQGRFFQKERLIDVGAKIDMSKERVRQLANKALLKMRAHAERLGLEVA